jgi:chromosome segregation ATPase
MRKTADLERRIAGLESALETERDRAGARIGELVARIGELDSTLSAERGQWEARLVERDERISGLEAQLEARDEVARTSANQQDQVSELQHELELRAVTIDRLELQRRDLDHERRELEVQNAQLEQELRRFSSAASDATAATEVTDVEVISNGLQLPPATQLSVRGPRYARRALTERREREGLAWRMKDRYSQAKQLLLSFGTRRRLSEAQRSSSAPRS